MRVLFLVLLFAVSFSLFHTAVFYTAGCSASNVNFGHYASQAERRLKLSLRVVTYNTQAGLPGTSKLELLKAYRYVFRLKKFPISVSPGMRQAVIHATQTNADLLCLNEIPAQWINTVLGLLGEAGYTYSATSATNGLVRWSVGTIVSSRHPAQSLPIHLPRENTLQGGGGTAALYVPRINTAFVGTHLGWEAPGFPRIISRQIDFLADYCFQQKRLGRNVVMVGDFNTEDLSKSSLVALAFAECTQPTYPRWEPQKSLDHILCDPRLSITHCGTFQGSSDHLGLYADIKHPSS